MSTTNLGLEEIVLEDTINGTMLQKINSNMEKLDYKYGKLKESLLKQTGKETLAEAIAFVQILANQIEYFETNGEAQSGDIMEGKTAIVKGELITGNGKIQPIINVTLDSSANATYAGYISGYGAGIDQNGNLVIWAMSNTANYEHINFVNTSISIGTISQGWNITTAFDTTDGTNTPHACTITGLSGYSTININLKPTAVNSTDDYVTIQVTVTGS